MSRLPPKPIDDRSKYMTKEQVTEYTHNSFKSNRAALNRHLQRHGYRSWQGVSWKQQCFGCKTKEKNCKKDSQGEQNIYNILRREVGKSCPPL